MSDVWLKRDIANALNAAYQNAKQTADALSIDREQARMFALGYRTALVTIALFFGIEPNRTTKEIVHETEPFEL